VSPQKILTGLESRSCKVTMSSLHICYYYSCFLVSNTYLITSIFSKLRLGPANSKPRAGPLDMPLAINACKIGISVNVEKIHVSLGHIFVVFSELKNIYNYQSLNSAPWYACIKVFTKVTSQKTTKSQYKAKPM